MVRIWFPLTGSSGSLLELRSLWAFDSSCGVTGGGLQGHLYTQKSPQWQWHHELLFMNMQSMFSHISQMLLRSGVLIQLSLGKHIAQQKGFEIWRKPLKQNLLSLNVFSWRNGLYMIISRVKGNCWIMLQTWEFVSFCHGHFMALLPVLWIRNL